MKKYIGTKIINAKPMTLGEYNDFCGWPPLKERLGSEKCYLIQDEDDGEHNTQDSACYPFWQPADVFEKAYRMIDGLSFGLAIEAMKKGKKVSRKGWNGKGMFLWMIEEYALPANHLPFIQMKTVDGKFVPWLASQTDMLEDDWFVVVQG